MLVLGINHQSAPIAIREKVNFAIEQCGEAYDQLRHFALKGEFTILSTCNRTDIYTNHDDHKQILAWLASYQNVPLAELEPYCYYKQGDAAVKHIFRVACGLDSMVIGETQILGQLKKAVHHAKSLGALGINLHKLFNLAFEMAKKVRSETDIGKHTISMAAAAVQLSLRIFPSLSDKKILFIGAGEMIELCMAHFAGFNPQNIVVANRTLAKAHELAHSFGGRGIKIETIAEEIADYDIIISCTASPLPLIGLGMIERAIKKRRHRPIFMVDLAVPRDIESDVAELDDVYLYSIDDLSAIVSKGSELRSQAVIEAEKLLENGLNQFHKWQKSRKNVPLIKQLRSKAEKYQQSELLIAKKSLARGVDPEQVIEQLAYRLSNKILHAPSKSLHNSESGDILALAAESLFALE